ncbi:MAG: ZIP family metal transporter [Patescibacteria group bacterium]
MLFYSLAAALVVGLVSFVGALSLVISGDKLNRFLIYLVAFSAGSLIGAAFFHLLPEVLEASESSLQVFVSTLAGFSVFFVLERVLRWHHCHSGSCETHQHLGWMNLIGDGFHNLIDGMVIFAAFAGGPVLGVPVTLSIILHEVPQELGDFGVLIYSGFTKRRALVYNFLSAAAALLGVLLAYFLYSYNEPMSAFLLPFAAGGFIYIAASDLIPEIHKDEKLSRAIWSYLLFIAALVFMYFIKVLFE